MGKTTRRLTATLSALVVAFAVLACASTRAHASSVPVRSKIAAYSWGELKSIANEISEAKTNKAGLKIAKKYHLVNSKGKLTGQTKKARLKGLGTAKVRIAGLRHDTKASGGKVGITFEFANAVGRHAMSKSKTSKGGWQKSGMRRWLNSTYLKKLPSALRNRIVTVRKKTNNVGKTTKKSSVTTTKDKLWLLSMREVYGKCYTSDWGSCARVYNAEGTQYQFYANNEMLYASNDMSVAEKTGSHNWWWLRSPYANYSHDFHGVNFDGAWDASYADHPFGVSPGFCF